MKLLITPLIFGLCLIFIPSTIRSQGNIFDEIVIQMREGRDIGELKLSADGFAEASPYQLLKTVSEDFRIYVLSFNPSKHLGQKLIEQLNQHPFIESAQANLAISPRGITPNDLLFDQQWYLEKIKATEAWELTTGGLTAAGDTIVVAVLDTGCDPEHPDMRDNLWINYNEIPGDGIDNDNNGYIDDYHGWNVVDQTDYQPDGLHGCGVSGIIGAKGNNELGTAGINWNIKIMMVSQAEYVDEIIAAYIYTFEMRKRYNESGGREGAFLVSTNFSAGIDDVFCSEYPIWGSLYDSLGQQGVLNVAATSPYHTDVDQLGDMPTTCPSDYLLSVTTSNRMDQKPADRYGYGTTHIDLAAPGIDIFSARPRNQSGDIGNGTSFATPMVAGAIGLLYSLPSEELAQLAIEQPAECALLMRQAVLKGVDKNQRLANRVATSGRLNIFKAILEVQQYFGSKAGALDICQIIPNPASKGGQVEIVFQRPDLAEYDIRIFDAMGKLLVRGKIESGLAPPSFFIPGLERWTSGVYFISIQNDRDIHTSKFILH